MNRQHTREEYLELVDNVLRIIPDCAISQDMIIGFCGETEEDFQDTKTLMEKVKFDFGYMYTYSERPGTLAGNKMIDDVSFEDKKRRLTEIIQIQQNHSALRTKSKLGETLEVLIEGNSKKSALHYKGRTSQNLTAVFPKENFAIGDFVNVRIEDCTVATLIGTAIEYSENN